MLLDVEGSATCEIIVSPFCPAFFPTHDATRGNFTLPLSVGSIQLTATSAQSVRLVMALSEAGSSLRCEVVSIVGSRSGPSREAYSF